MMLRHLFVFLLAIGFSATGLNAVLAQDAPAPRVETGGAQTLEDILARQRGETITPAPSPDTSSNIGGVAGSDGVLSTLGSNSDADVFRNFRDGSAPMVASTSDATATTVMQDGGIRWLELRRGPLPKYGGYMILGMMAVLLLFYLVRGKIRIEGGKTGRMIFRFTVLERIAHWAMAIPFVLLAFTGLSMLFGRIAIIPLLGKEAFSTIAIAGKFIHNYVAWVFMFGLILSFLLWVMQNFPNRADFKWLLKGGGLFTKGSHPPAGKFNAGEKIIFWAVIFLGTMISATGLAMLFPFQLQMFAPTYEVLNSLGIPQLIGLGELNTALAPQEEMQFAQLWHSIIGFIYITIIIAHIYLGSIGMEGALQSMTKGEVDEQWAKEHHSIWYDEVIGQKTDSESQTPAE